jgi:hypothetical protein
LGINFYHPKRRFSMKKKLIFATNLALVVVLVLALPVLAAPPGSWVTDFTLFNLGAGSASVTITRYAQCTTGCGADAGTVVASPTIAAGGSYYYNPVSDPSFPTGFAGSIAISSTEQLAGTVTLANNLTGSSYASDAYSAVSTPATISYLPIVLRVGNWSTRITVQNTGATAADVTIAYVGSGKPSDTLISGLPSYMMAMVDLSDLGALSFNGSATVTATQPVAVVVEEYKTTGGVLVTYNGIPSATASTTLYLPGYIDQGLWATDMTIVSAGGSGTVTVTFAGSAASLSGPVSASSSPYLNRYGSLPSGWTGTFPTGYYGAATVTSTTPVVTAYNISNSGTGGAGNLAQGYVGFSASQGALKVVVPLIERMYSTGWNTTFSVQSLDGTPASLSMTYSGNLAPLCNPCTVLMSSASQTFNQTSDGHVPVGFLGGVKITSDKNIVVIADQANTTAASYIGGDSAAGFVGFPSP